MFLRHPVAVDLRLALARRPFVGVDPDALLVRVERRVLGSVDHLVRISIALCFAGAHVLFTEFGGFRVTDPFAEQGCGAPEFLCGLLEGPALRDDLNHTLFEDGALLWREERSIALLVSLLGSHVSFTRSRRVKRPAIPL